MILPASDGSGRRFVHTRRCRYGCPQIRLPGSVRGLGDGRVDGTNVRRPRPDRELEVMVMPQNWAEPARLMVERLLLDAGAHQLSGLWSLTKAAQQAALRLALDPAVDSDLSMTHAAMDLAEALEELEWSDPAICSVAVALDLDDPPAVPEECREVIASLLVGAFEVTAAALRAPAAEASSTAEVLMLARVVHLLTSAHLRVVGRLP